MRFMVIVKANRESESGAPMKRCPAPSGPGEASELEISRGRLSAEGRGFPPEAAAREQQMRDALAAKAAKGR